MRATSSLVLALSAVLLVSCKDDDPPPPPSFTMADHHDCFLGEVLPGVVLTEQSDPSQLCDYSETLCHEVPDEGKRVGFPSWDLLVPSGTQFVTFTAEGVPISPECMCNGVECRHWANIYIVQEGVFVEGGELETNFVKLEISEAVETVTVGLEEDLGIPSRLRYGIAIEFFPYWDGTRTGGSVLVTVD